MVDFIFTLLLCVIRGSSIVVSISAFHVDDPDCFYTTWRHKGGWMKGRVVEI